METRREAGMAAPGVPSRPARPAGMPPGPARRAARRAALPARVAEIRKGRRRGPKEAPSRRPAGAFRSKISLQLEGDHTSSERGVDLRIDDRFPGMLAQQVPADQTEAPR